MRTDILGVGFDDLTITQAVEKAAAMMVEGGFHYAVTPNAEFVQRAEKDGKFRSALNGADLVLPDGIGVVYAAKILGRPLQGRVPGCDFAAALCDRMAEDNRKLFLLGAKPGVAEQAARNLEAAHPGLTVCGTHDGYFQEDGPVVEAIRAAGADAVFVCLGAPKQEYWMIEQGPQTGAAFLIGLGGSLDVFAGTVKRAPEAWQKLGLEWLYRLVKQPSRIGRMAKLPLFLVSAVKAKGKKES
ncbi:MAG: WecB/TagA/CpsF family glycosyltransferase [Oscillospiraceae bacterium]